MRETEIVSEGARRSESSDALLAARFRVPQHVVFREFPAETVALNLQTEQYHGLNPTAGRMLVALQRTGTVSEAAIEVAREFDQPLRQVRGDLLELCGRLLERGLIEIDGSA